ncbi:MAG: helix-turn-helix transcriptional regulator [Dorea sp.]|jgi:transcriptional regulator with XRE-family HTH domain|nr:helix-turn-helix transcriptional regulator [Dorea sp.]
MNERIKLIRKEAKLSQEDFGNRLSITKASISRLESGINNPSDQTISLICKEFNVNEDWLRTGAGGDENRYIKTTPFQRAYNRFGYIMENSIPSKKAALSMLLELLYTVPDEAWNTIMKEFEEIKKED